MTPVHGLASTYTNWACRCAPCTAAHTEAVARQRRERAQRLAANPSLAPHGNPHTYLNWGCRCWPCTQAHASYLAARRKAT